MARLIHQAGAEPRAPSTLQRLRNEFLNPTRHYVITSADFCRRMAAACTPEVAPRGAASRVAAALGRFGNDLLAIRGVEAAAFLAHDDGSAPTTVAIDILTPLTPATDAINAIIDAVMEADGRLADGLDGVLPTSLSFVDTAGIALESIEDQLREKWKANPAVTLLAFAVFQRHGR